ncbi:fibroblast growth factor receptor-like 1a isoform X2 [Festucalex cinctus]
MRMGHFIRLKTSCKTSVMTSLFFHLLLLESILMCSAARGPPRVSQRVSQRQSVRLGRTIKLPCPVEGDPPPLLMWTKGGRNIHSGWTRFRPLRQALRIKEVEADDGGAYVCKATNGFGSVSVNHTLIIIDDSRAGSANSEHVPELAGKIARPRFTQPAKMRKRVIARPVGSSVRLKCAAGGNPRPDIVWLKDGRPLARPHQEDGKQKWTLSLKSLTPEHSGKYTCHVSNPAGRINATYKVEVIQRTNSKPILTGTHPVNTTVDFGASTSFQCKVRSDVKPVIQWLKRVEGGHESKFNSTLEVGDHRFAVLPTGDVWSRPDGSYLNKLLITRAKKEDAGMYVCLGANTMGYSFRSAYLTVLPDATPRNNLVLTAASPGLPWPAIIGIPAGVAFVLGTALLWFCRSKGTCPSSSPSSSSSSQTSSALPVPQRLPVAGRERARPGADTDDLSYEDYAVHRKQSLTSSKPYPKIYTQDIHAHTHTHSHVDGKVHRHQHIHYQCYQTDK